MAIYRILYWQEIPSQVKAEDEDGDVNLPLHPSFMARIDRVAMEQGLLDADAYLEHWRWSEEEERAGTAAEVAEAIKTELEILLSRGREVAES
jgi:hypothetical protein